MEDKSSFILTRGMCGIPYEINHFKTPGSVIIILLMRVKMPLLIKNTHLPVGGHNGVFLWQAICKEKQLKMSLSQVKKMLQISDKRLKGNKW